MAINLLPAAQISATGLSAEKARMQIAANNMANAHSTKGADGEIYHKKVAVFSAMYKDEFGFNDSVKELNGVDMTEVAEGRNPTQMIYMPYHPEADKDGMVEMPNISPIEEMLDMITATRAYEANLSVMKQSKDMAEKTITMTR
jgi:flagellar basal-body rod protein FlgC